MFYVFSVIFSQFPKSRVFLIKYTVIELTTLEHTRSGAGSFVRITAKFDVTGEVLLKNGRKSVIFDVEEVWILVIKCRFSTEFSYAHSCSG